MTKTMRRRKRKDSDFDGKWQGKKRPVPRTSTPEPTTSRGTKGGRPARTISGTTTTSLRLQTRRPRRPLVPPPDWIKVDSTLLLLLYPLAIPRDMDDFDDSNVDDDLPNGDEQDLQQLLGVLINDVQSAAEGRQIKGITTTNTITTVYKGRSRATVRRNSTRATNPRKKHGHDFHSQWTVFSQIDPYLH